MNRSRAAWLALATALALAATYLLLRRRSAVAPAPGAAPFTAPPLPTVEAVAPAPVTSEHRTPSEPPLPDAESPAVAAPTAEVEAPLPTWARAAIIAAALVAFFAVSLIATKHV